MLSRNRLSGEVESWIIPYSLRTFTFYLFSLNLLLVINKVNWFLLWNWFFIRDKEVTMSRLYSCLNSQWKSQLLQGEIPVKSGLPCQYAECRHTTVVEIHSTFKWHHQESYIFGSAGTGSDRSKIRGLNTGNWVFLFDFALVTSFHYIAVNGAGVNDADVIFF